MTNQQLIERLQQSDPDANVHFAVSIDGRWYQPLVLEGIIDAIDGDDPWGPEEPNFRLADPTKEPPLPWQENKQCRA